MKRAVSLTDRAGIESRAIYSYWKLADLMSWSQKLDLQKLILSEEKKRRDIDCRPGAACFCLLRLWTSITMWAPSKHVADIAASPHSGTERVITHVSRGTNL